MGARDKRELEEVPRKEESLAKAGDHEKSVVDQTNCDNASMFVLVYVQYANLNRSDNWKLLQLGLHRLSRSGPRTVPPLFSQGPDRVVVDIIWLSETSPNVKSGQWGKERTQATTIFSRGTRGERVWDTCAVSADVPLLS